MLLSRYTLSVCLLAAALTPASAQVGRNAMVRAVHASPDAPAVDVWLDGTLAFQGIRFKDYTDYAPVPAGTHNLQIVVSGTTTAVLGGPVTLNAGTAYSFIAAGRLSRLSLISLGDWLDEPPQGSTRIRVVHGAATAPSVDVYVSSPFAPLPAAPVLSGVPFLAASDYLTVPAGNYQARVAVAGTKNIAINSGRVALAPRTVNTVIALDPATANGPFELWAIPDHDQQR